jgi:inosine/xanthosine triphosphatase
VLVAVGSMNPVKIASTRAAFRSLWSAEDWRIEGCDVPSDVPDQPMSDREARRGAWTRANRAIELLNSDFGIGLEGGLQQIDSRWYNSGWVVALRNDGLEGTATTLRMMVPLRVMSVVSEGHELGEACDRVFRASDTKQRSGFFGVMSNNTIDRAEAFTDAVIAALSVFLHPDLMTAG